MVGFHTYDARPFIPIFGMVIQTAPHVRVCMLNTSTMCCHSNYTPVLEPDSSVPFSIWSSYDPDSSVFGGVERRFDHTPTPQAVSPLSSGEAKT
jgi:hypothetical protein